MGKFLTNPGYVPLADGVNWRLEKGLSYAHDLGVTRVPAGFVTDFYSTPASRGRSFPTK